VVAVAVWCFVVICDIHARVQRCLSEFRQIMHRCFRLLETAPTYWPLDTWTADCTRCTLMDSGLYTVHVNGDNINVYCDMSTEAGGWLVSHTLIDILRRYMSVSYGWKWFGLLLTIMRAGIAILRVHLGHLMDVNWSLDGRQPSNQAIRLGPCVLRLAATVHIHHRHFFNITDHLIIMQWSTCVNWLSVSVWTIT